MTTIADRAQAHATQFQRLFQEIALESKTRHELDNVVAKLRTYTPLIEAKKKQLEKLRSETRRDYEHFVKLNHFSFRSAAATLSGKKFEKTTKAEAKYQKSHAIEEQCKHELESLMSEKELLLERKSAADQQMNCVGEAQTQQKALLDEVFSVTDSGFVRETALKAELFNFVSQQERASHDSDRFKATNRHLRTALDEIRQAIELISYSASYNPYDLFSEPFEIQIGYLDEARTHLWDAQRRLNAARDVLPEIPHAVSLDVVTNNPIISAPPGTISFQAVQIRARQAVHMLTSIRTHVENSQQWAQQYDRYAQGAKHRLEEVVQSTRKSLEDERWRIVQGILDGTQNESLHVDDSDIPPPVYEAPPPALQSLHDHRPEIPTDAPRLSPPARSSSQTSVSASLTDHPVTTVPPQAPPTPASVQPSTLNENFNPNNPFRTA